MSDNTPRRLERTESPDTDADDPLADLQSLIATHERLDWSAVPQVSTAEAASWTQRLDQARHELEASTDGR